MCKWVDKYNAIIVKHFVSNTKWIIRKQSTWQCPKSSQNLEMNTIIVSDSEIIKSYPINWKYSITINFN